MPPRFLFAVALAALSAAAVAEGIADRAVKDETVRMSDEEPAMRRAFERAAKTLPEFLQLASNPREGTTAYALKVAISDGRNTEYFWVNRFSKDGEVFSGVLNNEPRLVKKHKLGERITFKQAQIVDWTYVDSVNRKMVGNFTACALLTREPPAEAAAFKRQYGLSCDE